jgi:hypothetical protein
MKDLSPSQLAYFGVDLSHARLTELMKLADAAKPFFDWVEKVCQECCRNSESLSDNLMEMSLAQVTRFVRACYSADLRLSVPSLFDGQGRKYPHRKACFYFISWLVRDAPVQRLRPIIDRASQSAEGTSRLEIEIGALARLLVAYRKTVRNFDWRAIREVVLDRLEGSRRAQSGRKKEIVVRTAVAAAVQKFFDANKSYGRFASVEIPNKGVRVGTEEFDTVVNLLDAQQKTMERVLIPVKTRETEGGGHSHLFTRDIDAAISTARDSGNAIWIAAFIIAQSWSARERAHVREICDFLAELPINPNLFETVDDNTQRLLDSFIAGVLAGTLKPKVATH